MKGNVSRKIQRGRQISLRQGNVMNHDWSNKDMDTSL